MRKIFLLTIMMFLFASLSIAQTTFSPTILQVTCPEEIEYAFGGGEALQIPVTVENLSGAFWLVINTVGKADQVDHVQNGYLGWHFVDRIDTTVYVSGRLPLEIGDNTITWDGTSSDSEPAEIVPEDTYAYYIYGYDDKTTPQLVTSYIRNSTQWDVQYNYYICYDESGMALEKPVILGSNAWYLHGQPAENITKWYDDYREEHGTEPPRYLEYGCAWKWEIGGNPDDINNLQTTWMPWYRTDFEGQPMFHAGQPITDFKDSEYFYHICRNNIGYENTMFRWKFVAGGDAERDEDFMGYENVMWEGYPTFKTEVPTLTTLADGSSPYFYTSDLRWHIPNDQWTPFTCVNIDEGDVVFDIQLDEYYLPDQENGRGEFNGTPSGIYSRHLNRIQMSSWAFCLQQMVDTTGLLTDPYDEDYIVWQNQNGDYIMDKKYLPTDDYKWICSAIDSSPTTCSNFVDQQGLGVFWTNGKGNINQTIVSHDGTGVAEINFFGQDTGLGSYNGAWVDAGSQYDGIYTPMIKSSTDNPTTNYMHFFVSQDSDGGLIIPEGLGVEEEAVEAYAIEQNAPNPFNPTTTIGFKLANAGNVTIDVFNVAGQKVDTIVNNLMEAGSHSVVWDASGFSAGVYFYTVKSGNFTKTMKMTLLK